MDEFPKSTAEQKVPDPKGTIYAIYIKSKNMESNLLSICVFKYTQNLPM